jgi:pyrimidine deaminase RibD-like protein
MPTMDEDAAFAKRAIDEAYKCKVVPGEIVPYVGAIAVKDGRVVAAAYRGECKAGEHAEFTLLHHKLPRAIIAGATIYTTLEPCTERNPPKTPCVEHLIRRKVARVVIGTLDPNPRIRGNGVLALRGAGIEIAMFAPALMAELEELNRDFIQAQIGKPLSRRVSKARRAPDDKDPLFLDWAGDMLRHYPAEDLLWWQPSANEDRRVVPQALLTFGEPDVTDSRIQISYEKTRKSFNDNVNDAEDYYAKRSDPYFDGDLAAVKAWDPASHRLDFQHARFFDFVRTNLAVDRTRPPLRTLRERSIRDGKLKSFQTSPLANATGINGLGFSNDGFMIYQVRNKQVAMRKNEACSAFSGFVDAKDVIDAVSGCSSPTLSQLDTLRELVEEIGIDRSDITDQRFLGITRELHRGGMPELFYALRIDLPKSEIIRRHRRDHEGRKCAIDFGQYGRPGPDKLTDNSACIPPLRQLIEKIEQTERSLVSVPLLTNLVLWFRGWDRTRVGSAPPQRAI